MTGSRLHAPGNPQALPTTTHHAALGVAFLGHPLPQSRMPGLCPDSSLLPRLGF